MRYKFILLITLITAVSLSAITLTESIELAKQYNKELLAKKSGTKAADWTKKKAFTNFLPKASFNSTMVRIDDDTYQQTKEIFQVPVLNAAGLPTGDFVPFSASALNGGYYKTTFTNTITVQQPVFNGGKMILGYQLAGMAKQQAELALTGKEKDVVFAVASTYLNLLKLNDLKTLSRKSLNSSQSHLESVLKKYDVGTARKSDVLQWQVKMKTDETAISEIKDSINELKGYWKNLLGTAENELPDRLELQNYDGEINRFSEITETEIELEVNNFIAEVKNTSHVIRTLDLVKQMMNKNYLMAKGSFLPSLNLQFSYQLESDDKLNFAGDDYWSLAALFSVPVFQSGANFSSLQKAKYEQKQTEYETALAVENYLVTAENAFRKLITRAQTVESNRIALEFARENHQIINDLYQQGLVTNSELLDAETMLFGSEMNLVAAYYDYILTKYDIEKYRQQEE